MTVVVMRGYERLLNVEVGVFVGEECREAAIADELGRLFLTIHGNLAADSLIFKVYHNGQVEEVNRGLTYLDDANYISVNEPYTIQLLTTNCNSIQSFSLNVIQQKLPVVYILNPHHLFKIFRVVDVFGRYVSDRAFDSSGICEGQLNLNNLSTGFYMLVYHVVNSDKPYAVKIIKQTGLFIC